MEKRIFHDFPSFPAGISRGSAASGTGPCYRAINGKGRIGSEKSTRQGGGNDAGRNRFRFGLGSLFTILYLLSSENSSLIVPSGMPAASAGKDFPRCAAYMVHNGDFPERRRDG
ncbi:MAG: hypothetical protein BAA03_10675 [Caldibacillus debilis]|nr:MAG: hypothetical protein BAA03_10675 [Caldibacillus debilis]